MAKPGKILNLSEFILTPINCDSLFNKSQQNVKVGQSLSKAERVTERVSVCASRCEHWLAVRRCEKL